MVWISVHDPTNITTAPVSSSKFDFNIRLSIALVAYWLDKGAAARCPPPSASAIGVVRHDSTSGLQSFGGTVFHGASPDGEMFASD
jgi:hypothetical protein